MGKGASRDFPGWMRAPALGQPLCALILAPQATLRPCRFLGNPKRKEGGSGGLARGARPQIVPREVRSARHRNLDHFGKHTPTPVSLPANRPRSSSAISSRCPRSSSPFGTRPIPLPWRRIRSLSVPCWSGSPAMPKANSAPPPRLLRRAMPCSGRRGKRSSGEASPTPGRWTGS